MKRFFLHYNRPASQKHGHTMWSVHFNKTCYIVSHIISKVPFETKENVKQPRGVIRGKCTNVIIEDGKATIV